LIAEQRKGQSLSLRGVARLMRRAAGEEGQYSGVDPQTIHDYERGRIPHPDPLRWLAAALGLPVEQVATAASQQRVARRRQRLADMPLSLDLPRSPSRIVEEVTSFTMRDLSPGLSRREAIKTLGAVVFGASLTEPLERWAMADPVVPTHSFNGSIGEEEVGRLEATVRALRTWESRLRMGVRRKAVIGQLNEVADLVKESQSPAIASRLFRVMAELSQIAASMSYDAGMHGAAQKYYSLALSTTDAAGDHLFGVNILADMSRQMLDLDRPMDGLELVRLALDGRDIPMPPRVRAMLRTREAWAYAKMGRVQAFQRAVGLAEETFARGEAGEEPHWIKRFDAAELSGVIGARYRDLARHDPSHAWRAIGKIQEALGLRDRHRLRNRAFDTVGLGRAYLLAGEPEEACRVTHPVLEMAGALESGRVCRRLRDLHREAELHRQLPEVAEFREEITERVLRGRRGVGWLG
ncbi:MAG: hypothetical protein ACRDJK_03640, partial [Actinomycetota bacterium]